MLKRIIISSLSIFLFSACSLKMPELNMPSFFSSSNKDFEALEKANIDIDYSIIQPFNCVWYNGCDCPVDTLTTQQVRLGFYNH